MFFHRWSSSTGAMYVLTVLYGDPGFCGKVEFCSWLPGASKSRLHFIVEYFFARPKNANEQKMKTQTLRHND